MQPTHTHFADPSNLEDANTTKFKELEVLLRKPEIYGLEVLIEVDDYEEFAAQRIELHNNERTRIDDDLATVTAAALSTPDGEEFYDGSEERILAILDNRLCLLEPGVLSTWGGSFTQLPIIEGKAKFLGIGLGLRLELLNGPAFLGGSLRRHSTESIWHKQRHIDLANRYKSKTQTENRANPISTDGEETDAPEPLTGDPRRGAHLARAIAERRWGRLSRYVDPKPATSSPESYAWTSLAPAEETSPDLVISGVRAQMLSRPQAN